MGRRTGLRARRWRHHGVFPVRTDSAPDAYKQWGWVDAHDRLFQMDVLRRSASGRLAELFGAPAVDADREARRYGLHHVAREALALLPREQRGLLDAYVEGVNRRMASLGRPLEYWLLKSRPSQWTPEDSLLVQLFLYQQLALDEAGSRLDFVVTRLLPPALVDFLLPRGDPFSATPDHGSKLPFDELQDVLSSTGAVPVRRVVHLTPVTGSNCWAVGAARTARGVPLLANDLHLSYSAPPLFHRVDVGFPGGRAVGFAVAGLPLLISGSNGHVAWGVANVPGDMTRLVERSDDAILRERVERLEVRNEMPRTVTIAECDAGIPLPDLVLGAPATLVWTGADPKNTDLGWFDLLAARDINEFVRVVHGCGSPPLAIIAADCSEVVQTVAGRFPEWDSNGRIRGVRPPQRLPIHRAGPEGLAIWTNDPPGAELGADVGRNYPASYRRHRLEQVLTSRRDWTEEAMAELQLDDDAGFFAFYYEVARLGLPHLDDNLGAELAAVLDGWDGRSASDSAAFGLLLEFRRRLVCAVFDRILSGCGEQDRELTYAWRNPEPALRAMLSAPDSLAPWFGSPDWSQFLGHHLSEAAREVTHDGRALSRVHWVDLLPQRFRHPMSGTAVTAWFDLPALRGNGGPESILAKGPDSGPVQRLVVAAGAESRGLVGMPGGQSGAPWSIYYRDQHRRWRQESLSRLLPGSRFRGFLRRRRRRPK